MRPNNRHVPINSQKASEQRLAADQQFELNRLVDWLRAGRYADAEVGARSLIARLPDAGVLWKLLALSLTMQGKRAAEVLEKAAQLLARDAEVHFSLGNARHSLGELRKAVVSYRRALAINPDISQAHNDLGLALQGLGEFDEALTSYTQSLRIAPNSAVSHTNLGNALRDLGRFDEAVASHQRALQIDPGFAEARINLGNVLQDEGKLHAAVASYRHALQLKPDFAAGHNALGSALRALGSISHAEASFQQAVMQDPSYAEAHTNLGIVLRLQGRVLDAEKCVRTALEINPTLAAAMFFSGELLADRGSFAEAEKCYRRAIEIAPSSIEAWAAIPGLRRMTLDDTDWLAGAALRATRSLPRRQEISLSYAVGKYFDDVRDFPQAFASYRRANELTKLCAPNYEGEQVARTVTQTIKRYNSAQVCSGGHVSEVPQPIFIVGMPRSGTSLAEHILASHRAVFGAGELPFWGQAAEAYDWTVVGQPSDGVLSKLRGDYMQLIRRNCAGETNVVDKMPSNFLHLGLINATFPNAHIIHLRRNPIDTCVSIYFQDFDIAHAYATDLDNLASYYQEYSRLMSHWRAVLPRNRLLEVPYEALVEDMPSWSRKMLEFVGLPWDDQVLRFDQTSRSVATRSRWQVRQKINSGSVERWRNYQDFVGPLAVLAHGDEQAAVRPTA